MLPDAFIHTMRMNEWRMPAGNAERVADWRSTCGAYDYEPWETWAFQYKSWYVFW
ncbi:MAG: hypothetical protein K8U57_03080 [Planctomycetes bacterium]|nr:hypothetical protein [Planctomycetota bacterium]